MKSTDGQPVEPDSGEAPQPVQCDALFASEISWRARFMNAILVIPLGAILPTLKLLVGIRSRLPQSVLDAIGIPRKSEWPRTSSRHGKTAIFLLQTLARTRFLEHHVGRSTSLPALRKTVFLLDHFAYGGIPHARRYRVVGIRQKLAHWIVTTAFPGLPAYEDILLGFVGSEQELRLP
jgi:hypothetical protein